MPSIRTDNFGPPFADLAHVYELWTTIGEPMGYLNVLFAIVVAAYALAKRGIRHPLAWVVILQLGFLTVLTVQVLVPARSAPRQVMPLLVASAVMLVTPKARLGADEPVPASTAGDIGEP